MDIWSAVRVGIVFQTFSTAYRMFGGDGRGADGNLECYWGISCTWSNSPEQAHKSQRINRQRTQLVASGRWKKTTQLELRSVKRGTGIFRPHPSLWYSLEHVATFLSSQACPGAATIAVTWSLECISWVSPSNSMLSSYGVQALPVSIVRVLGPSEVNQVCDVR